MRELLKAHFSYVTFNTPITLFFRFVMEIYGVTSYIVKAEICSISTPREHNLGNTLLYLLLPCFTNCMF